MRIQTVAALGGGRTVVVRRPDGEDFGAHSTEGVEVALYLASDDRVLLALPRAPEHIEVIAAGRDSRRTLQRIVETNLPSIAWVVAAAELDGAHTRVLHVQQFPDEIPISEPWVIGADDRILEQAAQRSDRGAPTASELPAWLSATFIIGPQHPLDKGRRVLASAGIDADLAAAAFQLHGRDATAAIRRTADGRLMVDRLGPRRIPDSVPTVLVRGDISFADATEATTAAAEEAFFGGPTSEYLALWERYDELDRRMAMRAARSAGCVPYTGVQALDVEDGVRFRFSIAKPERLADFVAAIAGNEVTVAATEPAFLSAALADDDIDDVALPKETLSGGIGAYDRAEGTWLELASRVAADGPAATGVLFMSLRGDQRQRERRADARAEVLSGRAGLPRLVRILQGEEAWQARRRRRREPALSPRARKALGGTPTKMQRKALDIALNTPDVAVIQGPPGTGKTGVIAALAVRLTEIAEERREGAVAVETTLLTSYQNEAVSNVGRRTNVMGFPARIAMPRDQRQTAERAAVDWAHGVADAVERVQGEHAAGASPTLVQMRRTVLDLVEAYRLAPGARSHGIQTIDDVLHCASAHLDPELVGRLHAVRQRIARQRESVRGTRDQVLYALRRARGLRVTATAFEDDGPARAAAALGTLDEIGALERPERDLLARYASAEPRRVPPAVAQARGLRDEIVDRLQQRLDDIDVAAADVELVEALDDVNAALIAKVRNGGHAEAAVLADYLDMLRNDPAAVEHVHRRYSRVVAATCQRSRDHTIADPHQRNDNAEYEVVIVDEAARANPLDLLIPLSAARSQVVLVGDHRQLPHLLDLTLEGEIATSDTIGTALRQSAFERLFESLRRQSERDGVPRVVTLNRQFRMHPRLGTFVSDTFYKPYGEKLENGVSEEARRHDVPLFMGRVAHWEDVPFARGGEKGRMHRVAEAEVAVDLLQEVAHTGSPGLSAAIITFYAEQRKHVIQTCIDRGLGVGTGDRGGLRFVGELAGRASVGTVDAFQGREFDVVILSPGRSNNHSVGTGARAGRRRYGFLTIENRACVAMSRARRLLLVAGDRNYASNARAQQWIQPFAQLVALCDEELERIHARAA